MNIKKMKAADEAAFFVIASLFLKKIENK